jgi:rhodanese-related sulfurtransferase
MKWIIIVYIAFFLSACENNQHKIVHSPDAFQEVIGGSNVQVLDVRTLEEFNQGHIKNAFLADWKNQSAFKESVAGLDKKRPVLVYCAAGPRSSAAADYLSSQGFKVSELAGGMNAWKAAGKPVNMDAPSTPISISEYKIMTNLSPVVLVDFGAEWCPPCKQMDPVIEQLKAESGMQFKVVKVDAGVQMDLMKMVSASAIPTFIIYKNGVETWRKEGIVSIDELKHYLN